jgi:glyoxylase-like metal-dependent hydrolase (beta-lactamase superfamily II)
MRRYSAALILLVVELGLLAAACGSRDDYRPDRGWRVFAIEYGSSTFNESTAISGGDKNRRVPFSWQAWLLLGPERTVLVDTGFNDSLLAKRWRLKGFKPVDEILEEELDIPPERVCDVLLTHLHWDHVGNLLPFEAARVWVQKEELRGARRRLDGGRQESGGLRKKDLDVLALVEAQGRLKEISGNREILPDVRAHVGGEHTAGIQWLEIDTGSQAGKIVLASDYAYLGAGIEQLKSTGSTADVAADVAQLQRMRNLVRDIRMVIPGHDPAVMDRFPKVTQRVVELR